MPDIETVLSESAEEEFNEFLHQQIRTFNNDNSIFHRESRKPGAVVPINLMLKDEAGNWIGGLTATTYWNWLDIEHFYIPESLRRSGIGSALLKKAEEIALNRGCEHCFLTTFNFQARFFYEKYGYYVVGELKDYPPGSVYYWMRKDLKLS
jgi:GNAT superfamily N-acetyltransferase